MLRIDQLLGHLYNYSSLVNLETTSAWIATYIPEWQLKIQVGMLSGSLEANAIS